MKGHALAMLFGSLALMGTIWSLSQQAGAADMTRTRASKGDMVYIPAGDFTRGAPNNVGGRDERPQKVLYLNSFWIDRYEVTTADYLRCVKSGTCAAIKAPHVQCNHNKPDRGRHPINCMSWRNADAYCRWVGKRLPTEAEWEKAARGGRDVRDYPWGNQEPSCELACMDDGTDGCGTGITCPIGTHPKGVSPYGVHDMSGSVWEWVSDFYEDDYYQRAPNRNPKGPSTGDNHAIRGGGFTSRDELLRVDMRGVNTIDSTEYYNGFRCASNISRGRR